VDADVTRALSALEEQENVDVAVADMETEGIKLTVATWAPSASERAKTAAGLRLRCIERLQQASILGT
jgi:hypothetical protein